MPTDSVRLHPNFDRFFQSQRGISLGAHVSAVAFARSAQLKAGNDTTVITNDKIDASRTPARTWKSIEIAELEYETVFQ